MEININHQDLDKYIRDSILKSSVGKLLLDEMEKGLKEVISGYNSPVKSFIAKYLQQMVEEYLQQPENEESIKNAIAQLVTPDAVMGIVSAGLREVEYKWRQGDN